MYPLHFAGALMRAEDPRVERNRAHLLALSEGPSTPTRHVDLAGPVRRPREVTRLVFAGGSTSLSADFGAA